MFKKRIKIKGSRLPNAPGVYLFKDKKGRVVYIGKAASLKTRVGSYFRNQEFKTRELLSDATRIDYQVAPTVIEALILEAALIKKHQPKYNVREKDDKSFLYVCVTKEDYPKPILVRGFELSKWDLEAKSTQDLEAKSRASKSHFEGKPTFGPFTSAGSIRAALSVLRRIFPWSTCQPNQDRPCFYYQIKQCPGVCAGEISREKYNKNIRNLVLFFQGKKTQIIKKLKKEMKDTSKKEQFEKAAEIRNQIFALEHIQDVALIKKEVDPLPKRSFNNEIDIFGRIEGYDISNIGGKMAVGSMVVFGNGEPKKIDYRKFKIKTLKEPNDVGMLEEVLRRRFTSHPLSTFRVDKEKWVLPRLIVVDGGRGQVNTAQKVLQGAGLKISVIGIAKGLKRKNDRLVYDKNDLELERITDNYKNLLLRVRDEAHRFALTYHQKLIRRRLIKP